MTGAYVLIFMFQLGSAASAGSAEFHDRVACEAARAVVMRDSHTYSYMYAVCVPK